MEARKTGKITRLLTNIPPRVALALMERRLFLPGVNVLVEPQRRARLGHWRAISWDTLGKWMKGNFGEGETKRFGPGQWVGKTGLEKVYDGPFRGTDGGLQFEVDARAAICKWFGGSRPTPGNDIYLTIDRRLQSVAEAGLASVGHRARGGGGGGPANGGHPGHGQRAGI
jgi:penicillin-binding protein 2